MIRAAFAVVALGIAHANAALHGDPVDAQTLKPPVAGQVCVFVLDLVGDGLKFTSPAEGVLFDLDGSGKPIQTGWTAGGADDSFLALDVNDNGRIESGAELAGNGMRRANGERVGDSIDALVLLQGFQVRPTPPPPGIEVIDDRDKAYPRLRIWTDGDHDGQADGGELRGLAETGITAVRLTFNRRSSADAGGNVIRFQGSFSYRQRGMDFSRVMAEVCFARQ